jgi:hypothetical protein
MNLANQTESNANAPVAKIETVAVSFPLLVHAYSGTKRRRSLLVVGTEHDKHTRNYIASSQMKYGDWQTER